MLFKPSPRCIRCSEDPYMVCVANPVAAMVGSTYTYLAVSRLQEVEEATQIRFRWRPFNVRAIMQEMNNIPFATKPIKLKAATQLTLCGHLDASCEP